MGKCVLHGVIVGVVEVEEIARDKQQQHRAIMTGYTADEKLRMEQLITLRRKWLKDQELSAREPVLQPKSMWRLHTYKAYTGGVFALTRLLIPARVVHYYVKYHVAKGPYGIVDLKPKLFPGDTILETGEVVPDLPESHGHH